MIDAWLTASEICYLQGISRRTFYRWAHADKWPKRRQGHRMLYSARAAGHAQTRRQPACKT